MGKIKDNLKVGLKGAFKDVKETNKHRIVNCLNLKAMWGYFKLIEGKRTRLNEMNLQYEISSNVAIDTRYMK